MKRETTRKLDDCGSHPVIESIEPAPPVAETPNAGTEDLIADLKSRQLNDALDACQRSRRGMQPDEVIVIGVKGFRIVRGSSSFANAARLVGGGIIIVVPPKSK